VVAFQGTQSTKKPKGSGGGNRREGLKEIKSVNRGGKPTDKWAMIATPKGHRNKSQVKGKKSPFRGGKGLG